MVSKRRKPTGRSPAKSRSRPGGRNLPTASFVVRGVADFTPRGRRKIATWAKRVVAHLLKHGDGYAPRFTARLNLK